MSPKIKFAIAAAIILAVIGTSVAYGETPKKEVLRLGYFPNLTHETAVIGGNGDFQNTLAKDNIELKTLTFNAGPSAIEALFANRVDITYIGPNPAINGHVVSEGKGLRIISGATSGGASLVVRSDAGINSASDFNGKKFATPQLGNTQDVALKAYLLKNNLQTKDKGGTVEILNAKNPDIVTLFINKKIDGAWVPEPWATRLVHEGNGTILIDERTLWPEGKFVLTHIIVRTDYLQNHPDVVKKFLAAHVDETIWIQNHPDEALVSFNAAFKKLTGQTMPEDQLKEAATRINITYDPIQSSLYKSADAAFEIGLLGDKAPNLDGIYDLTLFNEVLKEKNLIEKTKSDTTKQPADTKDQTKSKVKDTNTKKTDVKKTDTKKTDKKDTKAKLDKKTNKKSDKNTKTLKTSKSIK